MINSLGRPSSWSRHFSRRGVEVLFALTVVYDNLGAVRRVTFVVN